MYILGCPGPSPAISVRI